MSVKPTIISIAAVSGGGKTTITQKLGLELENTKEFFLMTMTSKMHQMTLFDG